MSDGASNMATFAEPLFDMATYDEFILDLIKCSQEKRERDEPEPPAISPALAQPQTTPAVKQAQPVNHNSKLSLVVQPYELKLVPVEEWKPGQMVTLASIINTHFRARSTRRLRFEHKLWNALCLTKKYPDLIDIIGIRWESKDIIKVDRDVFGSLLGLTRPTAALFNPQGSFQSHGFQEVNVKDTASEGQNVRYFRHTSGAFDRDSTRDDLGWCKWIVRKLQMQQRALNI